MLLLDEPTHGLDPLSAYLLISILSNTAKKTGCGILLSLEKPRSDVFPFLDRALFLCLGGVVYSGGTRAMLEYFHGTIQQVSAKNQKSFLDFFNELGHGFNSILTGRPT